MDEGLRDAERVAREHADAPSWLRYAAALRRAGRAMEGAAAAFTARGLGATRDEVFPLGAPLEGGGDALAPWPHPRGSSAGTGRSVVEGPGAGAKVLFRVSLEGTASFASAPLVLPDGSVVVGVDQVVPPGTKPTSRLVAVDRDGVPRWTLAIAEAISPLVLCASGDLAFAVEGALVRVRAHDGKLEDRVALVRRSIGVPLGSDHLITRAPVAWNRSLVVRESIVRGSSLDTLRGRRDERILVRGTPVATADGWAFVCGSAYRMGPPEAPGRAPPILVDPLSVFAFGREGELRWVQPWPDAPSTERPPVTLVAGRRRLLVAVGSSPVLGLEPTTGKLLGEIERAGRSIEALDAADEPIRIAPFGPPVRTSPVVDAADRRYVVTERLVVGLGPEGEALFALDLALEPGGRAHLAIAPGRLYCVWGSELVCIGLT